MTRNDNHSSPAQNQEPFKTPGLSLKICTFDQDLRGESTYLSAGFAQLLGWGDEALTLPYEQALARIHPDDVASVRQSLRDHLQGKTPTYEDRYRVRHADGSYRWVMSQGLAQKIEGENGYRMVGSVIDITEQRQLQERERGQQRLTQAVAEIQSKFLSAGSPGSTFDDLLGRLLDLTESAFGFIGELLYDGTGSPYLKAYAITDIAWNADSRALFEKMAPNLEFRNLSSLFGVALTSGKPVIANDPVNDPRRGGLPAGHPPLNAFLGLPFSNGTNVIGMVGIANRPGGYGEAMVSYLEPVLTTCASIVTALRIESARQAAEQAMKESEQRYRQLVEHSPDAVIVHQDSRVVFANRAAAELLDAADVDELLGFIPQSFIQSPAKEAAAVRNHRILTESWIPPLMEARVRTLKGVLKDVEFTGSRVMHGGKPAVQAVWRDISARKRAQERELRSRRLESLGRLAGGVAHDFNNILAAIGVNLEMALADPSASLECLQQMKLASERAAALVRQILSFSRPGSNEHESVDLRVVVTKALDLVRPTVPAMIELRINTDSVASFANVNSHLIHQVVINLVANAVHAIGLNSGEIMVDVSLREDVDSRAAMICLRIADTGKGMDEHTQERIFDPFFTTKAPGEGVGLGLSIAHEIIQAHGGHIEVNSAPGKGTVLELYFPQVNAPETAPPPKTESRERSTTRVLFLDDDPLVNFAMTRALNKSGYDVTGHLDPRQALEHLNAHRHDYDVLVADLAMPGMSGLDFARAALEGDRKFPIVLASGYFDVADEAVAKALGITQFLAKPYDLTALMAAMDTARASI